MRELEKGDIDYLKQLSANIERLFSKHNVKDESRKQVMEEAFSAGVKILESNQEGKAKILLALSDNEPCGIIIGNALKADKKNGLHYSSRKNHSKYETELDWLVSWNEKIKGVGKSLVTAFFDTLGKDGFKSVYVRSEVPEKSGAVAFYKKMGFRPLSDEQRLIQRKNDNGYLIGKFDDLEDRIVPMKATTESISKTIKQQKRELGAKEIKFPANTDLVYM